MRNQPKEEVKDLRASRTDDGRADLDCLPELGTSASTTDTAKRASKMVYFIIVQYRLVVKVVFSVIVASFWILSIGSFCGTKFGFVISQHFGSLLTSSTSPC